MGAIVDCSRPEQIPPRRLADVVVIGSGSGGATAARLLAEAGFDVVVLEEGPDRSGVQLNQRDGEMYDQIYMERGGRATDDLSITILQGRVLGGGGVINAADVVPIPEAVKRHWETRFSLSDFSPSALAPFEQAALEDLSANPIGPAQLNRNNRLVQQASDKLGWRGEIMHHNRLGCAGLGTCLIGCPIGAKKNPRQVAIPAAIDAGATFYVRARAVSIKNAGAEIKQVNVRALNPRGYHEREAFTVRARVVVVAANAIGSTQLCLRSGLGGPHAGRHLSLQPQLPVVAKFDAPVVGFRGIPQAYAVTEFERADERKGLSGFRLEPVFGTPGIVSTLLPFSGPKAKRAMVDYPYYAALLVLVPDAPVGRVTLKDDGRPRIVYPHPAAHKARCRQGIKAAARIYFEAGARWVQVPSSPPLVMRSLGDLALVDQLSLAPCTAPFISAHQQGGLRFAHSENAGSLNPTGEVFGTRGVYVFDSAGYPSSASSHTMAPIITTARMLTAKLLTTMKR